MQQNLLLLFLHCWHHPHSEHQYHKHYLLEMLQWLNKSTLTNNTIIGTTHLIRNCES